jgi:RNA polymerase sigma-70 factor (ECF subfamily)
VCIRLSEVESTGWTALAWAVGRLDKMRQKGSAEELASRRAEHDPEAAEELYDQYAPSLLGMLMQILGDRGAAEEILDDVFIRVLSEARSTSREGCSLGVGLFLLARARAIERLRGEQSLPAPTPLFSARKPPAWLPRAEEVARLDQRQDLFRKVVNQLPKQQREMLNLAVFKGLTEEEIAAKLSEPSARVRAGMLAAVRFLRHRLAAITGTWAANI